MPECTHGQEGQDPPLLGNYLVSQVHNKSSVDAKGWWSLADLSKSSQGY